MAEEGLKIKVSADASGVPETFSRVAQGVRQANDGFNKLSDASRRSTETLMNVGRVAQDLPYGFMGIANNLNPLLESFQRLKTETGSTKTALSALLTGLTGPAGIGLALGVVSSLLVTFGDRLFSSGSDAESAAKKLDIYRQSIEDLQKATARANKSVENKYDVAGAKYSMQGNEGAAFFMQLKSLQEQYYNLKKLKTKVEYELSGAEWKTRPSANPTSEMLGELKSMQQRVLDVDQQIADNRAKYQILVYDKIKNNRDKAAKDAEEAARKTKALHDKELAEWQRYAEALAKVQRDLYAKFMFNPSRGSMPVGTLPTIPGKPNYTNQYLDSLRSQYEANLGTSIPVNINYQQTKELDDFIKKIKDTEANQQSLANMLNNTLTPAFENMFASIMQGENVFKSLGNAIMQAVTQLIAQMAAMAAVAAIFSAVTGTPFPASFKLISGSGMKIPGMATGGIVPPGFNNDTFPAMLSSGEAVIPLDKLQSIIGTLGGNNNNGFVAETRISGNDLVLLVSRAGKSINRQF